MIRKRTDWVKMCSVLSRNGVTMNLKVYYDTYFKFEFITHSELLLSMLSGLKTRKNMIEMLWNYIIIRHWIEARATGGLSKHVFLD